MDLWTDFQSGKKISKTEWERGLIYCKCTLLLYYSALKWGKEQSTVEHSIYYNKLGFKSHKEKKISKHESFVRVSSPLITDIWCDINWLRGPDCQFSSEYTSIRWQWTLEEIAVSERGHLYKKSLVI